MTKHILTLIFAGSLIVFSSDLKAQQADDNTPKLAASSKKASATTSTATNSTPKLAKVDIRSKSEQAEIKMKKGTQAMSGDDTPRLVTTSRKKKK